MYCLSSDIVCSYDVLTTADSPEMGSWKPERKRRGAELTLKMQPWLLLISGVSFVVPVVGFF